MGLRRLYRFWHNAEHWRRDIAVVLGPQANGLVLIFISAKWGSFDLSDSTLLARGNACAGQRMGSRFI